MKNSSVVSMSTSRAIPSAAYFVCASASWFLIGRLVDLPTRLLSSADPAFGFVKGSALMLPMFCPSCLHGLRFRLPGVSRTRATADKPPPQPASRADSNSAIRLLRNCNNFVPFWRISCSWLSLLYFDKIIHAQESRRQAVLEVKGFHSARHWVRPWFRSVVILTVAPDALPLRRVLRGETISEKDLRNTGNRACSLFL